MKNTQKILLVDDTAPFAPFIIKAHEATGHTTMREHEQRMKAAVTKSIQGDTRFMPKEDVSDAAKCLTCKPYCLDVTTPDADGTHHAIIRNHDGKLVKHGFDYDAEESTATLHDGQPNETERKEIYATEIDRHENMVKAMAETISCRAGDGNGIKLTAGDKWQEGKGVTFIYAPAGVTTINAGFRRNESITCTVQVDADTAKDLQDSFDFIAATEKQEPYADEDHEGKKATLRFPHKKVNFTYGTHRGEEGVIVQGAEPTNYGADSVNGKVYASWSPEFSTDAEYSKAKCKKGHWTFPDGIRGSASNPARLVAVNFVTGALTNKPAFKNMPNVKARLVAPDQSETIQTTWSDEARAAAAEARKKHTVIIEEPGDSGRHMIVDALNHHDAAKQAHDKSTDKGYGFQTGTKIRVWSGGYHAPNVSSDEKPKQFWVKKHPGSKTTLHENESELKDSTKATDATESAALKAAETPAIDPLLDTIFARFASEQDAADTIVRRSPVVQERIAAAAVKPDETVSNIFARKEEHDSFITTLVASDPVNGNRTDLEEILNRKNN